MTGAEQTPLAPGLLARLVAATALDHVVRRRADLDRAFAPPAELSGADRAFAYSILVTALRRRGQIAAVLDSLIERPLPPGSGLTRSLLETACAQLLFMGVAAHAVIHSTVSVCRHDRHARHFAPLANAVLRRVAIEGRARAESIQPAANVPVWLFDRWQQTYGEEQASAIVRAHLEEPPLDLTLRETLLAAPVPGAERLWNGTLRLRQHSGRVEEIPGFTEGSWWVQDQAAALPARLFTGPPGEALDICAAPGGKTAQLAAAGNRVTAIDRSATRLSTLESNLRRLNLAATVVCADFLQWQDGLFDKVLLDAPCSATGTIRRHPDIPWLRSLQDIEKLSALQTRLLDHAAGFVRHGGELIYCTCSLEPEEGEGQIGAFLARHTGYSRRPITQAEVAGHGELISPAGDLRTLPVYDMDGFFAARLVRGDR